MLAGEVHAVGDLWLTIDGYRRCDIDPRPDDIGLRQPLDDLSSTELSDIERREPCLLSPIVPLDVDATVQKEMRMAIVHTDLGILQPWLVLQ